MPIRIQEAFCDDKNLFLLASCLEKNTPVTHMLSSALFVPFEHALFPEIQNLRIILDVIITFSEMANLPEHLDPASQHQAVLQQAFNSLGNNLQGHAVTIVVEEGSKICVNSDFLIFHSPFFRSLVCSSSNSDAVNVFLPDTSATAVLALEGLLSKGVTRCMSKADEVETLARLLGIHQIRVNCVEGAAVPPRTILPADVFQEVSPLSTFIFPLNNQRTRVHITKCEQSNSDITQIMSDSNRFSLTKSLQERFAALNTNTAYSGDRENSAENGAS